MAEYVLANVERRPSKDTGVVHAYYTKLVPGERGGPAREVAVRFSEAQLERFRTKMPLGGLVVAIPAGLETVPLERMPSLPR